MIPNDESKYDTAAVFSPADALAAHGDGTPEVPPAILLGFQPALTDAVERQAREQIQLVRSQTVSVLSDEVGYVAVHEVGIGAPVAAILTENLIAAGAQAVVLLSGCGALDPELPAEAALLPTDSIRDEGVSYHYVPADEPVEPAPSLVDRLEEALSAAQFPTRRGRTWTTSALYRETTDEVDRYREADVLSVGMETAAVWAVCDSRGVSAATVHQIGDYVTTDEWVPEAGGDRGLPAMLDPTVTALTAFVRGE